MSGRMFHASIAAIVGVVLVQSLVHLGVVLGGDRIDTIVDLDRSNGLPDLASTAALAAAAAGAAMLSTRRHGVDRLVTRLTAGSLGILTLADLLHDGAHPSRSTGPLVIGLVVVTIGLLSIVALEARSRAQALFVVAVCLLAGSFLVSGLDRLDRWFERERGDVVAEAEIVAKEGLELAGWGLVAVALWDEALRRRPLRVTNALQSTTRRLEPGPES
jgi:hypothetical protein